MQVIAGFGYTGLHLAPLISEPTLALARHASQRTPAHIQAIDTDLEGDLSHLPFDQPLQILYLAPPGNPEGGTTDIRLSNFLNRLFKVNHPVHLVYVSTSGVYGNCHGAWVNEQTPLRPVTLRAKRRVDAEHQARNWQQQTRQRLTILRVPGIYGPSRLPTDKPRTALLAEADAPPTNLIHVEDLARCLLACLRQTQAYDCYNVSDTQVTTSTRFFLTAAELTGTPVPPVISWAQAQQQFDKRRLSFLQESRRLSIQHMQQLPVTLRYTTLAEGIRASI